jgi:hypothetical protein
MHQCANRAPGTTSIHQEYASEQACENRPGCIAPGDAGQNRRAPLRGRLSICLRLGINIKLQITSLRLQSRSDFLQRTRHLCTEQALVR